ncbi:MAG TPA: S8 family serine peptidase [Phycisphaeraceae bacterium]
MSRRFFIAAAAALLAAQPLAAASLDFNDPLRSRQTYLEKLHFPDAWARIYDLPTRGQVTIAVVDSGFDTHHRDLQWNLIQGINIVDGSGDVGPVHAHGTGVIGPIAASSGNGLGISQAAWTAQVMPIRVTNRKDALASVDDLARGIRYAADHGAQVINVSYSGVDLPLLESAARYAQQRGAVVFMPAGNDGQWKYGWPNHKRLVAVGSITPGGGVSRFSNRGKFVDLVAPGEDFLTLYPDDQYAYWAGTSFASPVAASVAALVLTANPGLAPWQVRKILFDSAMDLKKPGYDGFTGYGLVDAAQAVELALQTTGYYTKHGIAGSIPTVPNDLSHTPGLSLSDVAGHQAPILQPQGFITGTFSAPEPQAVVLWLALAGPAVLRRRRR